MQYIFDGTYYGWLNCIFEAFERKEFNIQPVKHDQTVIEMFSTRRNIITNANKADRILTGLEKHIGKLKTNDFYKLFLTEAPHYWKAGIQVAIEIFRGDHTFLSNFGNPNVIKFSEALHKVNRERHRMKAFVRFQQAQNGLYLATVEPDYNVLPLIIQFFKNRYTDQEWIIYDLTRDYGIQWDTKKISEVVLEKENKSTVIGAVKVMELDATDMYYQNLWKAYFKATNIVDRKNLKLHLRHVPRRYWKYLPEKQF